MQRETFQCLLTRFEEVIGGSTHLWLQGRIYIYIFYIYTYTYYNITLHKNIRSLWLVLTITKKKTFTSIHHLYILPYIIVFFSSKWLLGPLSLTPDWNSQPCWKQHKQSNTVHAQGAPLELSEAIGRRRPPPFSGGSLRLQNRYCGRAFRGGLDVGWIFDDFDSIYVWHLLWQSTYVYVIPISNNMFDHKDIIQQPVFS